MISGASHGIDARDFILILLLTNNGKYVIRGIRCHGCPRFLIDKITASMLSGASLAMVARDFIIDKIQRLCYPGHRLPAILFYFKYSLDKLRQVCYTILNMIRRFGNGIRGIEFLSAKIFTIGPRGERGTL